MKSTDIPSLFTIPWANSAGGTYVQTIPSDSQIGVTDGRASLHDGFPPLTFISELSGGVKPFGKDFNGILKWITQAEQWSQAGGPAIYSGTLSTAVGGYPKNAVVASATTAGVIYVCTVDDNITDPDASGAGWSTLVLSSSLGVFLPLAGGTMTGALTLAGAPTAPLHAAPKSYVDAAISAGAVAYFAMSSAPTGWLKANGAAVSRTTYATLFTAIGTTFGNGDGSTTFNLPDLRGEFLRGYDDSRGVDSGRTFGSSQKGSLVAFDVPGVGVFNIGTTTLLTLAAAQAVIGLDAYSTGDYAGGQIPGVTATSTDTLPGDIAGGQCGSGVTRPRNIALLACIKY